MLLCGLQAKAQSSMPINYTARTLDSAVIQIGAGQPATIVAVFATWCTTCRNEFGILDSLTKVLAPRGIRVLALSVDAAGDEHVRKYIAARKSSVAAARDASGAVGKTFGAVGVPESYLIDTQGHIVWKGRGDLRAGVADLRKALLLLR